MKPIGLVIYPQFQMLSVAVSAVFEFANLAADELVYSVRLLSEEGGPVRSSLGF